jgi:hypothetical protein
MRPAESIEGLIKNLSDNTSAEMDERVLGDVLHALDESKKTQSAVRQPIIGRTIMRSPIIKLAAAAVIVIAVLIGMNQLVGSAGSVAWGEVVQNIEASPGFIFRMKQIHNDQETGTREFHMMAYGSSEYGMRMDGYLDPEYPIQTYGSLKEETLISIMHSSKTYTRIPLSGDQLAEIEELDPKKIVRKYLSAGYRELGRKTIDGVEAEGVEITGPEVAKANFQVDSCVVQLWVAVDTGLPVLIEVDTVGKNGTLEIHTVQDNFQWNVELDASLFEPDIPEDYTLTGTADPQKGTDARLKKWRFIEKDPESGKYRLRSEDGQRTATVPEALADSPEHAVRVKEELDLQKQQGKRKLVAVNEIEVNGQLSSRFLLYEYNLSDGQTIRTGDFDPDDSASLTVIRERAALEKEVRRLWQEQRRQAEEGQALATTEERQVEGRVLVFKKWRLVLSDGREAVYSRGRLKDEQSSQN